MKPMMWTLSFAVACTVTAAAQTPAADQPSDKMMKGEPVTLTGCVAETTTGQFSLTNAKMAGKMGADNMPTDKAPADSMHPADLTYQLSGSTDLKPHVGHKVEVTGSLGKLEKGPTGAMDKDAPATAGAKAMTKAGTLSVTSMKMISATCP
jgi:hypothetical protein